MATLPVDQALAAGHYQVLFVLLQLAETQLGRLEGLRRTVFSSQHSRCQLHRSLRGNALYANFTRSNFSSIHRQKRVTNVHATQLKAVGVAMAKGKINNRTCI